jgi:two-component system sensor histidine kinase VicK
MRNGLLVIDDEGRIDTINAHAADVLSVDRSKICGESIDSLSDRTELSELLTLINANPGEPKKIKIDKQTFEVDVEVAQTEDGKNYTLVMLHDITKDEFIEDMKLTFVTVAAHQIRTPLSSIRWSLEILASQIKDEEQKKIAQRGYRSTQNMLEIVNALLNLDRLQSGQDGYNFESIDIVAMIDEYADEARANKRIIEQADIIFNPPQGSLPKVKADKEKLKIVIRNLIDNALKYTPTDGTVNIDASVHVTNDYGSDMVQIQIADDGIGIPPDSQDKIFSKFYRADNATKVKTDGTGIGLYISKQIIDEHDGTIWFESKEGEGTTFYIQLPIAQIQD